MLLQFLDHPGDPFRVVAGTSPVSDDLDPAVLFSSRWRGGATEFFQTSFGVGGSEVSGTFWFGRSYATVPLALGVAYSPQVGFIYPQGYVHSRKFSNTVWGYTADYLLIEVTGGYVTFRARRDSGAIDMNLRIWVLG